MLDLRLTDSRWSKTATGFEGDYYQPCARGRGRADLVDVKVTIAVTHAVETAVVHDDLEARTDSGLT